MKDSGQHKFYTKLDHKEVLCASSSKMSAHGNIHFKGFKHKEEKLLKLFLKLLNYFYLILILGVNKEAVEFFKIIKSTFGLGRGKVYCLAKSHY